MHSHLIPGIDDGAKDMEDSIRLIRGLADLGYRKLITTPHILADFYPNTPETIGEGLRAVQAELASSASPSWAQKEALSSKPWGTLK